MSDDKKDQIEKAWAERNEMLANAQRLRENADKFLKKAEVASGEYRERHVAVFILKTEAHLLNQEAAVQEARGNLHWHKAVAQVFGNVAKLCGLTILVHVAQ